MIQARPFQDDMLNEARAKLRALIRRILFQAPTGSGKTILAAIMLGNSASKGLRSWFVVHRKELLRQSSYRFRDAGVAHSFIASNEYYDKRAMVHICGVQTLVRRLDRVEKPDIIIWDECIAGDSEILTEIGTVAIKDVATKTPKYVLSYKNGEPVWKKITAWRKTGTKKTIEVVLSGGQKLRATSSHPLYTKDGWKDTGKITIGEKVLCLAKERNQLFSEPLPEIFQSHTPISDQKPPGCMETTELSRPTGAFTRPASLAASMRRFTLQKTKGMGRKLQHLHHLVASALPKYTKKLIVAELKKSQSIGLNFLGRKELHGGIAMMEPCSGLVGSPDSTLRDSDFMVRKLPENLSRKDMGTQLPMNKKDDSLWQWIAPAQTECSLKLKSLSQSSCGTSWEEVISLNFCEDEDVFDISVEDTECFFANGALVHNCHHAAATSWSKIMAQYPGAIHIGLSATPERLDGKGLDKYFDYIIKGPTVEWLIEHGYLSPYKIYAPNPVSMEGVATSMGDYAKSDVQKKMDKRSITGDAIAHYNKLCRGAQFIAFCSGIEHSKHVAEQFTAAGIPCLHVDGETPDDERLEAMRKLESREVLGLSNVDLFGEGVDVPSLQAVILLRPTQSRGLHLQQIGRALRPSANKPYAVILDHAGNSLRLGLPDDPIEWSLKGREKAPKGSKAEVATKSCPICFAVVRPMVAKCPDPCGHVFINKERKVTVKEGELQEVDVAAARYKRLNEQRAADTVEALVALGTLRGYKNPHAWAWQLNKAREAKQAKRRG